MFYLAAGDSEEAFWGQLLVIVILAAGGGVYTLVKSRAKRIKREASDEIIETLIEPPAASRKRRDIRSGMELLARIFLVRIAEQAGAVDRLDIEMQKMCFAELVRRKELWALSGEALKIYTLDDQGLFGKLIQREAMGELASRTEEKGDRKADEKIEYATRELNE